MEKFITLFPEEFFFEDSRLKSVLSSANVKTNQMDKSIHIC